MTTEIASPPRSTTTMMATTGTVVQAPTRTTSDATTIRCTGIAGIICGVTIPPPTSRLALVMGTAVGTTLGAVSVDTATRPSATDTDLAATAVTVTVATAVTVTVAMAVTAGMVVTAVTAGMAGMVGMVVSALLTARRVRPLLAMAARMDRVAARWAAAVWLPPQAAPGESLAAVATAVLWTARATS
ncbi:MAG: hypothetical protein ACI80V_001363 [Rhodothermales bacterium]|jgi:hypothetical protein